MLLRITLQRGGKKHHEHGNDCGVVGRFDGGWSDCYFLNNPDLAAGTFGTCDP